MPQQVTNLQNGSIVLLSWEFKFEYMFAKVYADTNKTVKAHLMNNNVIVDELHKKTTFNPKDETTLDITLMNDGVTNIPKVTKETIEYYANQKIKCTWNNWNNIPIIYDIASHKLNIGDIVHLSFGLQIQKKDYSEFAIVNETKTNKFFATILETKVSHYATDPVHMITKREPGSVTNFQIDLISGFSQDEQYVRLPDNVRRTIEANSSKPFKHQVCWRIWDKKPYTTESYCD